MQQSETGGKQRVSAPITRERWEVEGRRECVGRLSNLWTNLAYIRLSPACFCPNKHAGHGQHVIRASVWRRTLPAVMKVVKFREGVVKVV